ncbi:MAG: DNA adenine methylase [Acidimicrobiales bacterium]|nr:DNA adenine methylase [Acidimicrobiales bacterium]
MIKYLGSKRRLVPVLDALCSASGAATALDLFTGTTRVAQTFKHRGLKVTAVDSARYAELFALCYVTIDAQEIDPDELATALAYLDALPGEEGYVTEVFCRQARFFRPENGCRIDAIRKSLDADFASSPLFPVLLTSLIEAADRVDSTTGQQMAYLKQWAPRAQRDLELRRPELLSGTGRAIRGDALALVREGSLGSFDLAYIDPPYNRHRYTANYHVWETLVAWDTPEYYGVACKRTEVRDGPVNVFNRKATMPGALAEVVAGVDADVVVLSYNDESWLNRDELESLCRVRGEVQVMVFEQDRYVGARIGIHGPDGTRVGDVSHTRNREYVVLAGDGARISRMTAAVGGSV